MLIAIIVVTAIMFKKLKFITPFNISIYLILAVFWICLRVFNEQLIYQETLLNNEYIGAAAIGITSFVQMALRLPLARLSQKLKSRKIPILIAFSVFVVFAIPFIVVQNGVTFIFLGIAAGGFASTFGMENLYFSENWSFKHVFITVAIISFLPTSGIFVANIFNSSYIISSDSLSVKEYASFMRWMLTAIMAAALIVFALYVFLHKERKETIRKDLYDKNEKLASFTLKDLLKVSVPIFFLGLANQLIFREEVSGVTDEQTWLFIYVLVSAASIFTAILTSLVLIRHFRVKTIIFFSRLSTLIGITLGMIMWFGHIHSVWIGGIFIFLFATSVTMYETTLIGVMAHFDQKNKMLVLTIWLTVRSLGYAFGDTTGSLTEASNDNVSQWLVLGGFLAVLATIALTWTRHLRMMNGFIYTNVDKYENKQFDDGTREKIWK